MVNDNPGGKNNSDDSKTIRLGLKPNINQFLILVLVNAFVGAMVGLEQTVVPLIGKDTFHIESNTLILSFIASFGTTVNEIGFLKALHPGIWGVLQLLTGSLSDRIGRKILIYPGMIVQAIGVWTVLFTHSSFGWITGMSLLGIGTALVYPTLLAAISDIAHPRWRATSLGVYRFWRDLGFVFGAVGIGFIADISSTSIAIQFVAWIALASGIFVLIVMREIKRISSMTMNI